MAAYEVCGASAGAGGDAGGFADASRFAGARNGAAVYSEGGGDRSGKRQAAGGFYAHSLRVREHSFGGDVAARSRGVGFFRGVLRRDRSLLPWVHEVPSAAAGVDQ